MGVDCWINHVNTLVTANLTERGQGAKHRLGDTGFPIFSYAKGQRKGMKNETGV